MSKILIVEDEQNIREFEVIHLKRKGYETVEAGSGEEALELFLVDPESFSAALLDVSMPGMDGFELCKRLREVSDTLGIIMLTARSQEEDKIGGLSLGADDYVTKPFSPSELLARVEALLRRVNALKKSSAGSEEIQKGRFVLNTRKHTLLKGKELIELTTVEYLMMEYFFRNIGKQIGRIELMKYVWGESFEGDDKIVDVNIRRLRMKIEDKPSNPEHLKTVRMVGYMWVE